MAQYRAYIGLQGKYHVISKTEQLLSASILLTFATIPYAELNSM